MYIPLSFSIDKRDRQFLNTRKQVNLNDIKNISKNHLYKFTTYSDSFLMMKLLCDNVDSITYCSDIYEFIGVFIADPLAMAAVSTRFVDAIHNNNFIKLIDNYIQFQHNNYDITDQINLPLVNMYKDNYNLRNYVCTNNMIVHHEMLASNEDIITSGIFGSYHNMIRSNMYNNNIYKLISLTRNLRTDMTNLDVYKEHIKGYIETTQSISSGNIALDSAFRVSFFLNNINCLILSNSMYTTISTLNDYRLLINKSISRNENIVSKFNSYENNESFNKEIKHFKAFCNLIL